MSSLLNPLENKREIWLVLALVLATIVFIADLALPLGTLGGSSYFFVLWLTYFSRNQKAVMLSVVVSIVLILVGLVFSLPGVSWGTALSNQCFNILALAVSGLIISRAMIWQDRTEQEILKCRKLADELTAQNETVCRQSQALTSVMEDLKLEREQLRTSEKLFRMALEANPTAIVMTDEAGWIRIANREAERLFEYPRDSMVGVRLSKLLPELRLRVGGDESTSGSSGDLPNFPLEWRIDEREMLARTRNGQVCDVQVNTASIPSKDSWLDLYNIVDLSSVREHTRKLQQARQVAEQATKARGEFLANMSHEIRTPMTAILGFVDIISERTTDADNLQALDVIRKNGHHLLQLINDILVLSKIDAGKLSVSKVIANISDIVGEIRSMMDVQASESKKTLDFKFANEIPEEIETDPLRLRQILLNLIGNALKFTVQGGVVVTTSYRPKNNLLQFEVVDTGIGISPKDLDKLFQPFSQVDSSSTREFEGSGLGLVISRRLAQALGGDLTVVSEIGKGSVFTLTIPGGNVSKVRHRPDPRISTAYLPADANQLRQIHGTVLVVDDRRDIRFLAQHLIEKSGASVLVATNGREAIDLLLDDAPSTLPTVDLVLMDMQMPVMDGYEATRILRESGFSKPIIALTANAMLEDREQCLAAGCTDFITKPIDSRRLFQILNDFLGSTSR